MTKATGGATDLDVKTATGVTILKEFPDADSEYGDVSDLTAVGSKLFFAADPGHGQQLWVTNGSRGDQASREPEFRGELDGRRLRALLHRRSLAKRQEQHHAAQE